MDIFKNNLTLLSYRDKTHFYFPSKVFKNTKIIKLENIDRDWNIICDLLGKKMNLQKVNKTDHLRPGFEKFYTKETCKMIAKMYKIDFKKFGYSTQL